MLFFPFDFGDWLLKLNIGRKGTLIIKGFPSLGFRVYRVCSQSSGVQPEGFQSESPAKDECQL